MRGRQGQWNSQMVAFHWSLYKVSFHGRERFKEAGLLTEGTQPQSGYILGKINTLTNVYRTTYIRHLFFFDEERGTRTIHFLTSEEIFFLLCQGLQVCFTLNIKIMACLIMLFWSFYNRFSLLKPYSHQVASTNNDKQEMMKRLNHFFQREISSFFKHLYTCPLDLRQFSILRKVLLTRPF